MEKVSFTELCSKLANQETIELNNIDDLFNPSDYLVSPFNAPDKFMEESYFLTTQQEQIYKSIQKDLANPGIGLITLTNISTMMPTDNLWQATSIICKEKCFTRLLPEQEKSYALSLSTMSKC